MKRMINKSDCYIKVVATGYSKEFISQLFMEGKSVIDTFSHSVNDRSIEFCIGKNEMQEFYDCLREEYYRHRKFMTSKKEEQIYYFVIGRVGKLI